MLKTEREHESQAQLVCSTIPEGDHTAALSACTQYVLQLEENPGKTESVEHALRG